MIRIVLTLAFPALLLLTLWNYAAVFRLQHGGADQMSVLANGLTALGLSHSPPDESGLILAAAPGCPAPLITGLFAIDGGENARFESLITPGTHPLFIYLGTVRNRPDRWRNAVALLGAFIRGMAGSPRHDSVPVKMAVAILPDVCPELAGLNWTALSPRQ